MLLAGDETNAFLHVLFRYLHNTKKYPEAMELGSFKKIAPGITVD